jgi:thiol-disulfide isomerase/thioredoxin
MFRLALSVAAIAAVTVAAFAGGHAEASDVATLTSKTFDGIISKEEVVLVKFFAPWCGHWCVQTRALAEG